MLRRILTYLTGSLTLLGLLAAVAVWAYRAWSSLELHEALTYVTGSFTLVAFIVAGGVWAYQAWLKQREALILGAPEDERARLVESTLEFFRVDPFTLTREQRFELAIRQIEIRAKGQKRNTMVIVTIAVLSAAISAMALSRHSRGSESYKPQLEIVSGATVNGAAMKLRFIEQLQNDPSREGEILTVVRVLDQLLSRSDEMARRFDSKVYAYQSLPFKQDSVEFTARSATFQGQSLKGTQNSAFLVRQGNPEVIRLDISKNEELTLHVPAAREGDRVLLLLWVWSERRTSNMPDTLKFQVE